jgi:hypothetical protein
MPASCSTVDGGGVEPAALAPTVYQLPAITAIAKAVSTAVDRLRPGVSPRAVRPRWPKILKPRTTSYSTFPDRLWLNEGTQL